MKCACSHQCFSQEPGRGPSHWDKFGRCLTDNQGNKKMISMFLTESVLGYDAVI